MKWQVVVGLIATLSVWLVLSSPAAAQPLPPARFWGTLTLGNQQAPEGVEITAVIGDKECGKGRTIGRATGINGMIYAVDVLHSGQEQGCGEVGKEVVFKVEGQVAPQRGTWDNSKGFIRLDLTAELPEGVGTLPGGELLGEGTIDGSGDDSDFTWWIIPVGVVAAVVVIGGGFFAWRRMNRPNSPTSG